MPVYLQPSNPLRPVSEYANDFANLGLKQQELQQRNLMQQYTQEDRQRSLQEQDQVRNALSQLGPNAKPQDAINALSAIGTKTSIGVAKAIADTAHVGAQAQQSGAAAAHSMAQTGQIDRQAMLDDVSRASAEVIAQPTLENARQSVIAVAAKYRQDPTPDLAQLQQIGDNPEAIRQWAQGHSLTADQMRQQLNIETQTATQRRGQDLTAQTAQAGQAVTMRGQDVSAQTAREGRAQAESHFQQTQTQANKEFGKPPQGYAWGPVDDSGNPTLLAVKGGPADRKQAGALNQDTQQLTSSLAGFDRLGTAANEILQHPGLPRIVGPMGKLPNYPGSEAANAEALLATLKSQVSFSVLQDLRNNSKTGGALGQVSDAEGKRLESNLAALDKTQSLDQFRRNLAKIVTYTEQAKDRMRQAYNLKHGEQSVNPATPQAQQATTPVTPKIVDWSTLK